MSRYKVIGLMSGSSLDGLDIAYCHFEKNDSGWTYTIVQADCIAYTNEWLDRLKAARTLSGRELWKLHTDYGHLLAGMVNSFIDTNNLKGLVDLIASHGHTVFHFPGENFTTQIGDGAALAVGTGIMAACDFRSADMALGGQGTPIVPIADLLLFPEYKYLLNIGGIANLTIKTDKITAFDICAANQVLNYYASQRGFDYDADGELAEAGHLHKPLLEALNQLPYYKKPGPKSLDNGFSREVIVPLIDQFNLSIEDKLHTYCEHIAGQVELVVSSQLTKDDTLLITGGGAFNKFLVEKIRSYNIRVHIPASEIVQYKEALAIAFIGVLRLCNETNVLSSVTGASRDSVCGALYHP